MLTTWGLSRRSSSHNRTSAQGASGKRSANFAMLVRPHSERGTKRAGNRIRWTATPSMRSKDAKWRGERVLPTGTRGAGLPNPRAEAGHRRFQTTNTRRVAGGKQDDIHCHVSHMSQDSKNALTLGM